MDTRQLLAGPDPRDRESVNVTAMCSLLAATELIWSSSLETMGTDGETEDVND